MIIGCKYLEKYFRFVILIYVFDKRQRTKCIILIRTISASFLEVYKLSTARRIEFVSDLVECFTGDLSDRNDHICFLLKLRCVFFSGVLKRLYREAKNSCHQSLKESHTGRFCFLLLPHYSAAQTAHASRDDCRVLWQNFQTL